LSEERLTAREEKSCDFTFFCLFKATILKNPYGGANAMPWQNCKKKEYAALPLFKHRRCVFPVTPSLLPSGSNFTGCEADLFTSEAKRNDLTSKASIGSVKM